MSRQTKWVQPVLLFALLLQCSVVVAATKPVLNRSIATAVQEEVVPAYRQGNPYEVLRALSPLAARLNDEQIAAVDSLLASLEVPPVGQLLVESRLTMLDQNLAGRMPKAHPREILLALHAIGEKVDQVIGEKDNHPAMVDPLPSPKDLDEYEDLFWKIHVFDNRLQTATNLANYAGKLVRAARKTNRKSLDDEQRALLSTDYSKLTDRIDHLRRDLKERAIELRIKRLLDYSAGVVRNSDDFKERLKAAYVADLDGHLLTEFFRNNAGARFGRERLNDNSLVPEIEAYVKMVRESQRDLVAKSRLLFTGLYWWSKGRYGMGPDGYGLLKSEMALRSPQAHSGLYMPIETPKPTNPMDSDGYPIPEIQRRHHYIWWFEYRRIQPLFYRSLSTDRSGTQTPTQRTKLSRFY